MKRRTKKQIAMANAAKTIQDAGWASDSDEAVNLINSINKRFETTRGGSPELKEARERRKDLMVGLNKINKIIKTIRDNRQTLEDEVRKNNPRDMIERFRNLNDRITNMGGKAIDLKLDHMDDFMPHSEIVTIDEM